MTSAESTQTGNLPVSVWTGTFHLFGVELHCHVLDNGKRIIDAEDVARLMDAMADANSILDPTDIGDAVRFARWQKGAE